MEEKNDIILVYGFCGVKGKKWRVEKGLEYFTYFPRFLSLKKKSRLYLLKMLNPRYFFYYLLFIYCLFSVIIFLLKQKHLTLLKNKLFLIK